MPYGGSVATCRESPSSDRIGAVQRSDERQARPPYARVKRVALASATILVGVNLWTGCPLLALWVGSKTVGGSGLSMGAVFVVVTVVAAVIALEVWFFFFAGSLLPSA